MTTAPIVVLGGTGKVGRRLVPLLRERGAAVRVATRTAEPPFDWLDSSTWRRSLEGAGAVYVVYLQNLGGPHAAPRLRALCALAKSLGIGRVVLQSVRAWPEVAAAEEAVRASGLGWTILRPAYFSQDFSETGFRDDLVAGALRLPVGDGREPFVDVRDVADVAAVVLTSAGHEGRTYELSGPRLLTFAQAVAAVADATGLDTRCVPLPFERFAAEVRAAGAADTVEMDTEEFVTMESQLLGGVRSGANAYLSDGVRSVLGREPRDFDVYVRQTAATGVWSPKSR